MCLFVFYFADFMKFNLENKTSLLKGVFIASLISANLLGTKIAKLWIVDFSVGILAYPITFLITDVLEEVHGRRTVEQLVVTGCLSLIFVLVLTVVSVSLPYAERSFVKGEYAKVFGISIRIIIASIVAFLLSQFHDIWAFNFWKEKTKGKFLWLRNNFSTITSQFLDTIIFMFIAFYHVSPKFTVAYILTLALPYWLLKVLVALFDTPFVYLGVYWLKKD